MARFLPATLGAACLMAGVVLPGFAQEQGGLRLTFGINQGLDWRDNPDLETPSSGSETTSRTQLRLGLISETPTQRLAFDLGGTVVAGSGSEKGLNTPSATLAYRLESAASALELEAFLREADVDTLDFIFGGDDLNAPVVTAVTGSGTRRQTGATASIDFGRDAPFGGSFSLGRTETDYTATTDPSLIDSLRTTARLALRFDLSPVTSVTTSLSASRLEEEGASPEDSETLAIGLTHSLPTGAYTASMTIGRTEEGTRESLSFGRSLDLPAGQLSATLGLSRPVTGKTQGIGTLNWQQDLANGSLQLGLARSVTGNDRDEETRVSRLSMSYAQELTPRLGLSLSAGLQDSRETQTGLSSRTTNLSASLRQELTEDWGLNLGLTHRVKDEDGAGRVRSNGVFLSVSRDFVFFP
ncbi:hypothetical protein [Pseudotabrizicola formosa]|uniref:hypothetical protein n=1 Tax=Pseudotabrizicola formosa TaxID=2030009 RepID=UPI0011AF0522|nr:hypothetical protein [Pseudotabrizicola formosa]